MENHRRRGKRIRVTCAICLFFVALGISAINLSGLGSIWLDKESLNVTFFGSAKDHEWAIEWSRGRRINLDGTRTEFWEWPSFYRGVAPRKSRTPPELLQKPTWHKEPNRREILIRIQRFESNSQHTTESANK
jgi:hypothetical protein